MAWHAGEYQSTALMMVIRPIQQPLRLGQAFMSDPAAKSQCFPDLAAHQNHLESFGKTQLSQPCCGHSDPCLRIGVRNPCILNTRVALTCAIQIGGDSGERHPDVHVS